MSTTSRRRVLQLLGLAGASYALSSLGRPGPARAGGPTVPRRIVFFYTEQGTLKQFNDDGSLKPFWVPGVGGAPDALSLSKPWSTTDFELVDFHQPLVSHQNQLLLLDGLDMTSAAVDPTGAANAHIAGETHALVAANRQSDSVAGSVSIDQFIAQKTNDPSPVTPLASLELYVNPWKAQSGGEAHPLYAAAGQPVPIEGDPAKVYQRMFPNGPPDSSADAKAKLLKEIAQQKSALEVAYAQYMKLGSRLGALDRARLEAHAAAIRDLEKRLDLGATVTCEPPDPSIVDGASSAGDGAAFEANADILMHLAQTALACDLTRVMTFYVGSAPDELFGYVPVAGTTDFHDMVHKTNGVQAPLANDAQAISIVKAYHTYNAKMFAKFLDLLAAIPEADGTSLLDNTAVVWCGQIAGGDHSLDRIPYILAGKAGGAFTPGRYVRYPRKANQMAWPAYSDGPAHNDLFVSLANLMGVQTSSFGNAAVCKGPLVGLTG